VCVCTESNSIYFKRLKQIIPLPEFRIARNLRAHIFTDHYLYSGPEYCSLEGPGFEFRWARGFPHPSRLVLTLSLPYNVYWISFSGVSRLGYGVEHQPPPIAEVKERKELYLYSPFVPSWPVIRWASPFTFTYLPYIINVQRMIPFLNSMQCEHIGYIFLQIIIYNMCPKQRSNPWSGRNIFGTCHVPHIRIYRHSRI
jgi:hypothetical protein